MRVHEPAAIGALAARADAGDEDSVAWLERRDGRTNRLDDAYALMT
jgi:hypothetical protein